VVEDVGEGVCAERRVDRDGDGAEPRDAEEAGDEVGARLHHERDVVAAADPRAGERSRTGVGPGADPLRAPGLLGDVEEVVVRPLAPAPLEQVYERQRGATKSCDLRGFLDTATGVS
jgi:hypothetical protein